MGRRLSSMLLRMVLAVTFAALVVQAALPVQPELASSSSSSSSSSASSSAVKVSKPAKAFKCFSSHHTTSLKVDGIMGHHTTQNMQYFLSDNVDCQKPLAKDGVFGPKTKMELQSFLNMNGKIKLSLDGDFGLRSNEALMTYLKVKNDQLTPTQAKFNGVVDPAIIKALQTLLNKNRCAAKSSSSSSSSSSSVSSSASSK